MPNIGIHLLVAQRILDRWSVPGSHPPFPVLDQKAVSAYFHAAILPDAGYFPRGDRLFSELAHLTRTADVLRAQVAAAATPVQLGHAWGWATHVLADLAIHPLINAAHGELLYDDRSRGVTSSEDEAGHMRLEFGLDAVVCRELPEIGAVELGRVPDRVAVVPLCAAFERVLGWRLEPGSIEAALGRSARMAQLNVLINRTRSADLRDPLFGLVRAGARAVKPPRRWMPGRWNRSSGVLGVFSPIEPPRWLFDDVMERVADLALRLGEQRDACVSELRNHDLTTGMPELETGPSERARAALALLRLRQQPATGARESMPPSR